MKLSATYDELYGYSDFDEQANTLIPGAPWKFPEEEAAVGDSDGKRDVPMQGQDEVASDSISESSESSNDEADNNKFV